MIVIQMSGGLGNQMFQYALYVKLRSLGRSAAFDDVTQYDPDTFRDVPQKRRPKRLDVFGIEVPAAPPAERIRLTDAAMDPLSRLRRKLRGRRTLEKRDEDFIYDPSFLEMEEGYYCGNFQSPRYFSGAGEEVRRAFTFPEDILTRARTGDPHETQMLLRARACADRIREANLRFDRRQAGSPRSPEGEGNGRAAYGSALSGKAASGAAGTPAPSFLGGSASVHLRFGDYLDKPEIYGGICTDTYYETAVRKLCERDPEIVFFVFSNDRERAGEWVRVQAEKEQNRGRNRFVLVTGSDEDHGYLDLYLMTLCRNHIIANSSFSWWGAWLCGNPGKIIFAPAIWNNRKDGSELRRVDIYDTGMRRVGPHGEEITDKPLLSVIVTAYNVAPFVERAVDSVLSQTWAPLEVIAVDDGSTDGTGALLDNCAERDPRIRVVHTENGGVAAARNEGLRRARGEFIGFVDGDDAADPQMYEAMLRGMLISGADICTVNYREVWGSTVTAERRAGQGKQETPKRQEKQEKQKKQETPERPETQERQETQETQKTQKTQGTPERQEKQGNQEEQGPGGFCGMSSGQNTVCGDGAGSIDHLLQEGVLWNRQQAIRAFIHSGREGTDAAAVFHSAVWSKLFRRSLLKDDAFPEGTSAEDIPFTTKALCRAHRVLYLPERLYDYSRDRGESIMNSGRAQRTLTQEMPAWETHLSLLREAGEEKLARESEFYYYRRLLSYEEEYRRCPETRSEAAELQKRILSRAARIRELTQDGEHFGCRGDRARLRLYTASPAVYYALSGLYEKTVVAWRIR